ncbi:MAG: cupin domain-containing protein [candidate division WOR-3 bacterium]|nr:MAG: cupin domain-containing protein [candidate division WOR-3 bacterium]
MLVKKLEECRSFIAGDGSLLKEILNPQKQTLAIRYSLAHAVISPGQKTVPHVLKHAEVYYILSGQGTMHIDKKMREVRTNDTIYIPPNHVQFMENTADQNLKFLCIVDPAWQPDIETIVAGD